MLKRLWRWVTHYTFWRIDKPIEEAEYVTEYVEDGISFYCDGEPNAETRCCHDCGWLTAYVSIWCTNSIVREGGGDCFGTAYDCEQWKPMRKLPDVWVKAGDRIVIRKSVKGIVNNRVVT